MTSASRNTTVALDPRQVSFINPQLSAVATTGFLRAKSWATGTPYAGGAISGYVVATYDISFTDGTNQLRIGQSVDRSERTLVARTPPAGTYCMVVTLEKYDLQGCSTADRFCIVDWLQFGNSNSFN